MVEAFKDYIESENPHGLIYAPTQVGKTEAIIQCIKTCLVSNTPIVVSCDNKIDQLDQMYYRIGRRLNGMDARMLIVTDRKFVTEFHEIIRSGSKRYIIFVMNNAKQINKFLDSCGAILVRANVRAPFKMTTKFAFIHDEADTHVKHAEVNESSDGQMVSHKSWIELMDSFKDNFQHITRVKRLFVTATPESVCMLYNIKKATVFSLDVPEDYVGCGHKNFLYTELEDDADINRLVSDEVARIKSAASCEVILYCIERNIVVGQNTVMEHLGEMLDCIVSTYNGNGICAIFPTNEMRENFAMLCMRFNEDVAASFKADKKSDPNFNKNDMKYKRIIGITRVLEKRLDIKNMTIADFYKACQMVNETCVVTIGKDLIARGISYCGSNRDPDTFAATTMFYKPGTTMHAVGMTQAIGRITGTARPEVPRRLYAPERVIVAYKAYNYNKRLYLDNIAKSEIVDISVRTIIDTNEFCKLTHGTKKCNIDRPALGLKMRMTRDYCPKLEESDEDTEEESDEDTDETDEDTDDDETDNDEEIKKLVDRWWGKSTLSGKGLKYIYENVSVSYEDMVKYIEKIGSKPRARIVWNWTKDNVSLYNCINKIITLKPSARVYIDTLSY
jgi:hypothetical protein